MQFTSRQDHEGQPCTTTWGSAQKVLFTLNYMSFLKCEDVFVVLWIFSSVQFVCDFTVL